MELVVLWDDMGKVRARRKNGGGVVGKTSEILVIAFVFCFA